MFCWIESRERVKRNSSLSVNVLGLLLWLTGPVLRNGCQLPILQLVKYANLIFRHHEDLDPFLM